MCCAVLCVCVCCASPAAAQASHPPPPLRTRRVWPALRRLPLLGPVYAAQLPNGFVVTEAQAPHGVYLHLAFPSCCNKYSITQPVLIRKLCYMLLHLFLLS